MSKTSILPLPLILLALLPLFGCEEEPCDACKATECDDVGGAYAPWLQISYDECELFWKDGQIVLYVNQETMNASKDNEWTQLTITVTQGLNPVSVVGELCKTEDTDSPKSYRFSGSHSSGSMDNRENTVIAGDFIVGTGEKNVCGSVAVTQTTRDDEGTYESCSLSAAIYTHQQCCENKEYCR